MIEQAIGGYFELELAPNSHTIHERAQKYQSARAAFLALLQTADGFDRVWMPHYICLSMIAPVHAAGKQVCFYSLEQDMTPEAELTIGPRDILLFVNYFGVCEKQVDAVLERFNPQQVVIDGSQAFYMEAKTCLASIYSPRKFFGIPDGGLMVCNPPILPPASKDDGSEARMPHLIKRLSGGPESGYQDFQLSEISLDNMEPLCMSTLTDKLFSRCDHESARIARNENFKFLRTGLDKYNTINLPVEVNGPLCYPFFPASLVDKEKFSKRRIFMPTYWPDVSERVSQDSFEFNLQQRLLPVPCDQRYSPNELETIIELFSEIFDWNL